MKPKLDPATILRAKDIIFGTAKNVNREHSLDNLLIWMLNDKNGGTLKEEIVISHLGLRPRGDTKHGYDAWTNDGRPVEFKPETWYESSKSGTLMGGGNFNDLQEHKRKQFVKDDLLMIAAGFYEENLLYILQFPFRVIDPVIEAQMTKTITENQRRKDKGSSRVTPRFGFNEYKGYREVERLFLRRDIFAYKMALNESNAAYVKGEFPNGNRTISLAQKQKEATLTPFLVSEQLPTVLPESNEQSVSQ